MDAPLTHRVLNQKKVIDLWWITCGVLVGYFVGSLFHGFSSNKMQMPRQNDNTVDDRDSIKIDSAPFLHPNSSLEFASSSQYFISNNTRIYVATNPRGAESLPPGIVEPHSDFYLYGDQDLVVKPKYLLALAVGYDQNDIINEIVMKFSENFSIVLFHYDGRASEWDQFEWSHKAIHISASKQTKWEVAETQDQCRHQHQPPCAGFVEIMAPVFSRKSWECVWHMIQNDLVHGWGLDFAIWRCVQRPHEEIGVVDAQWVEHMVLPSLGDQGKSTDGRAPWEGVRARCNAEWKEFERRVYEAEHTN
ncbi:Pimeloyl-[acyl-carrier protein] methyl ester esterase [Actinidia chinensis var. chinensis]|uniref:Pimeloyl-[acyl-carrier protein] methyl ester esterase n=1 Tax=Actinidia chinensis var. chinensis TaxID=1590841 RepID=A0A2R6QFE7_ACTCC|nr:Pimeloyl-[acyl-carrier protein] methyl ester esterase [Actinidia chinensis var. chinensis]